MSVSLLLHFGTWSLVAVAEVQAIWLESRGRFVISELFILRVRTRSESLENQHLTLLKSTASDVPSRRFRGG